MKRGAQFQRNTRGLSCALSMATFLIVSISSAGFADQVKAGLYNKKVKSHFLRVGVFLKPLGFLQYFIFGFP